MRLPAEGDRSQFDAFLRAAIDATAKLAAEVGAAANAVADLPGEHYIHWWGRDADLVADILGLGDDHRVYLPNGQQAQVVLDAMKGFCVGRDHKHGQLRHRRTVAVITLAYAGHIYRFPYDFGNEYPEDSARFMWTDGNYGCDCNRALFIAEYCDPEFPEMDCGDEIAVLDLQVEFRP